jgi:DNA-binding transcriptional LysR family regulator
MFGPLFAERGLSLDRLKALLEVGAAGSIVKAAEGDPVRQSQYSRQIKELEDFFRARLIERQGKGIRLTSAGRELARISRFFMLGLSNFQRGCRAEQQTFTLGASSTFTRQFLLPILSGASSSKAAATFATEIVSDQDIERRLHDLTLDFGIVGNAALSRPLQTRMLGEWTLALWVPRRLRLSEAKAARAFEQQKLPLVLARKELDGLGVLTSNEPEACLLCDSFGDVMCALASETMAGLLPDFLQPEKKSAFLRLNVPKLGPKAFAYHLAWNPRLLRLNPHAVRRRDWLAQALIENAGRNSRLSRSDPT